MHGYDFNIILFSITGNIKLAIADLPPDHPVQQSLVEIAKADSRATDLVRRILTFSRPGEIKRQAVNLQTVVEEGLQLVRAKLPATVEFRTTFDSNLPTILADSTQIHQIIVNLATNAIGARSDGVIEVQLDIATLAADDASPLLELVRRFLCPRQRLRDGPLDPRPYLRSLPHHQTAGRRHRPRPRRGPRHHQERARNMGVRDLILKPGTIEQLGRALDHIFARELVCRPGNTFT